MTFQYSLFTFLLVAFAIAFFSTTVAQQQEPWRSDQLMNPPDLAAILAASKADQPVIICIGPSGVIPGSIEAGPANESDHLKKLGDQLAKLPKDKAIVLYCGCCPFSKCPNIRPAFSLLNQRGFTNHKLLNLPRNVKADWIDAGYPVTQ